MKILLVYPEFPDTFWGFRSALKFLGKKALYPPLGLLTVAAMLPEEWEKRLVDMNVANLSESDIKWADYVFISAMSIQRKSTLKIIERCKNAHAKIVAGGPLFTCEPENFQDIDYLILNEAEITLPLFLADLAQGCAKSIYTTDKFADLREVPIPNWLLIDMRHYASMAIQFSRGCPFDCDFCNVAVLFGHKPRLKSTVQMIAELDILYDLGWRGHIFVVDDNFIGNKKELRSTLLPALIDWRQGKIGMSLNTEASINIADDQKLMNLMVEAGFTSVFIGIESPNEESLAICNKIQNTGRDLLTDVRKIQEAGLQVQGGFIVGLDKDPPSIFNDIIEFIQKSGIVTAMVGLLQAPRGTRLYKRLEMEGRLTGEISGDNTDGSTNVVPIMQWETLREGYNNILKQIYSPTMFYQRIKTFMKAYKPREIKVHFEFRYILAFLRSIYQLGIKGKERAHYWNLLIWTLRFRPRMFPLAITLAISGQHFRNTFSL